MSEERAIESYYAALAAEEDHHAVEIAAGHEKWWADQHVTLEVEVRRAKEGESCPWCDEPGTSREGNSAWPLEIWMCGVCHRFMRQRSITPSDDGEMFPSGNHLIADGGCAECTIGWRSHAQDMEERNE